MHASAAPAAMPGRASGSATRQNTRSGDAPSIRGLQVERVAEGQLKWQVLMIQAEKNAPDFKGTLELSFVGTLDGKAWTLSPSLAQPVLIKSYLRQEGAVGVPPHAVVKTVTAKILQGGVVKSVQVLKL